jgi:hypothetical protein
MPGRVAAFLQAWTMLLLLVLAMHLLLSCSAWDMYSAVLMHMLC